MTNQPAPLEKAKNEWFEITPQGLKISNNPSYEDCEKYFKKLEETEAGLDVLKNAVQLARADLLAYIEDKFGEDALLNALDHLKLKMGSYRNMKSVAKEFPHDKRRPGVTYGHYQALQKVKDLEKREEYLDKIQDKRYENVHHLRRRVKIDTLGEDHVPTIREVLNAYSKTQLIDLVVTILDDVDTQAALTKTDYSRGVLLHFRSELEEKIRTS